MQKLRRSSASTLAVLLMAFTAAAAQSTTATLKGTIADTDGVGLPGVPITISSPSHGSARKTAVTDHEGRFRFQILPPASDYLLSVSYPGFAATEVGPIDLDPGKTTIQNITLRSARELTETVVVQAHGAVVDTSSTKTSTTFNTEYVEGLPIIGRNYQGILTLTPGVTDTDGDGNPNVQGARETGLQYRLDGGNITDPVSGKFGQNLNYDAIEEIEVITAGASAEYGRADGGFANIITKSGGNDFEGSVRLFWRGRILDGDGARENNDTFARSRSVASDVRRVSPYLTLGGPLKQDRLWYFASFQYVDDRIPLNLAGATIEETVKGRNAFAKVTWQADSDNKLAFQYSDDPREYTGLFLDFGTEEESDATLDQGGRSVQVRWTTIPSTTLLVETLVTRFDSGVAITPVSDKFRPAEITTAVRRAGNTANVVAFYPRELCSVDGEGAGFIPNCSPEFGDPAIYQIDINNGTTTGPYFRKTDDSRERTAIKTDLGYTIEDAWGEHQVKGGFEFADERFRDEPITNPYMISDLVPCNLKTCPALATAMNISEEQLEQAVMGSQTLVSFLPTQLKQAAESFNASAYLTDTWKPRPNLTFQAGLRIDSEDIDTAGFSYFDPRAEKLDSVRIVEGLCSDAIRVYKGGGQANIRVCNRSQGDSRVPGEPPTDAPLLYELDDLTPEWIRNLDRNDDGFFDSGSDGAVWNDPYTTFPDRLPEKINITNLNLSPRVSVAWDPRADGRTKIFSSWGRYYDRLFLDTISGEIGPDQVNFTFVPVFEPPNYYYSFSPTQESERGSATTITQVDRNLKTPYTDVFTLGVERELATEWSARVTYTQRLARDLLQDTDFNHVVCSDYQDTYGIDPALICPGFTNSGGRVRLDEDLFGTLSRTPNGITDLYIANPNFNQILRVGNFNSSRYRSLALEINRRLHRNWQMQVSYTYSRAQGQAEDFLSLVGDDPSSKDDVAGFLSFDQRHRAVFLAVAHLPKDVELGTTITWESGTPFSVTAFTTDVDSFGNSVFRTVFPTGERNDQRNGPFWVVDTKLVKRFMIGKIQASAEMAVNNLLNQDDLTLSQFRNTSGVRLVEGPQGLRRFGRFWELGLSVRF